MLTRLTARSVRDDRIRHVLTAIVDIEGSMNSADTSREVSIGW